MQIHMCCAAAIQLVLICFVALDDVVFVAAVVVAALPYHSAHALSIIIEDGTYLWIRILSCHW